MTTLLRDTYYEPDYGIKWPSFMQEAKVEGERLEYVLNRTQEILDDQDYRLEIMRTLMESLAGSNAIDHLLTAKHDDLADARSHLQVYMTKEARKIAESEARRRWGF